MKIVFEMQDVDYENKDFILQAHDFVKAHFFDEIMENCKPLPKGHGRLIDVDRLEHIQNERLQNGEIKIWELKLIVSALDAAETVVEADGGDAE